MLKFRFHKLVRDKIVHMQIAQGSRPVYHKLDKSEQKTELVKKITEEVEELLAADESEIIGEIADLQQLLDDLRTKYGLSKQDVARAQRLKTEKYGAFQDGIFLEEVEIADDNPWVEYYRKNPSRYPEI